jgi:DtxR family Mn-dependent transcriptional regulator
MLSPTNEDYLKAIYDLQQAEGQAWVTTTGLAQTLGVAPASVTEMLKRLSAAKPALVTHERYRGARLTEAGERAALQVVRTHRLLETFLAEALGFGWDEIHDEAHRLEHATSDKLGERIADYLGQPQTDPHGDPIPASDGTMVARDEAALVTLEAGQSSHVTRVHSQDAALLRYLGDLGLYPGVAVLVLEVAPFGGPLTVEVAGRRQAIGAQVAERVFVAMGDQP